MISFARIGKQYGKQILFVDASFQLNPGEKVGLVGPNGAGKTTLFRMIVGEEAPDEGDVSVPKKLSVGYFRQDVGDRVQYFVDGRHEALDAQGVCDELKRSDTRFQDLTGRRLDRLWRAPGGRTTRNTLAAARQCGYEHVGWAGAGFLGDELPSETHPNAMLVERALTRLRDGDIVMAHLGIWSRKDPFAPMLDPLLGALRAKGFCFAPLRERP